jgi:hypothetical protein
MRWLRGLLIRFRRDLPFFVAIWAIVLVGLAVLDVYAAGSRGEPLEILLGGFLMAVALTPLIWLRWERPVLRGHHATRRTFAAIGLALLWAVIVFLLALALLGALGIE